METPAGRIVFASRNGAPCVLKLHGPNSDEHDSATVLEHYGGNGAVRLIARDPGGLLIEKAKPGDDLTEMVADGRDDEATAVIAETIVALHRPPGLVTGLRTVDTISDGFDRFLRRGGDRRL
ncbi:MAG: hypothetical protein GY798_11885, partial [Hyphomicrobiales bacterium]|nr:hypothetical protein [Hyphomicrobiales bacterium]